MANFGFESVPEGATLLEPDQRQLKRSPDPGIIIAGYHAFGRAIVWTQWRIEDLPNELISADDLACCLALPWRRALVDVNASLFGKFTSPMRVIGYAASDDPNIITLVMFGAHLPADHCHATFTCSDGVFTQRIEAGPLPARSSIFNASPDEPIPLRPDE